MISKQEEAVLIALAELIKDIFIQQQTHSARPWTRIPRGP